MTKIYKQTSSATTPTGAVFGDIVITKDGSVSALNESGSLKTVFDLIYPVGSIYMSTSATNPSGLFGGTWAAWGAGRVPVGVAASGTFNTVEKTGGAETHTLTTAQMPSHTHTGPSHTHTGPSHTHTGPSHAHTGPSHTHVQNAHMHTTVIDGNGLQIGFSASSGVAGNGFSGIYGGYRTYTLNTASVTATNQNAGTGATGAAGTGDTGSAGTGATGASGTGATGSTGSGSAHNILQPYITCYMWKRTA
jgi:microcystin-dependent protein